jgi:DNA-binding response OmpR family regulator
MTATLTRVLIVDDHADIAEWLADELILAGYQAQTAYEGEAALELARTFGPDVMILDIAMPGMSGWEIARRVRKLDLTTRPRLIAVSAFNQDVHRERSSSVGFERHLVKPVKVQELLHVLANPPLTESVDRTSIES